jgi:hypothetical protein
MDVVCHLLCRNPLAQLVANAAAVTTLCLQRTPDAAAVSAIMHEQ